MMVLARRIELPLEMTIQGPHDTDPRKHRWSARRRDQDQGLHSCLPFLRRVIGLGKFGDVLAGILKGDELTATRQRDRIVKSSLPAAIAKRQPFLSNSILEPFGIRGTISLSIALQRGHGAPAAPQLQACSLPMVGQDGSRTPNRSPHKGCISFTEHR